MTTVQRDAERMLSAAAALVFEGRELDPRDWIVDVPRGLLLPRDRT